MDIKDLLLDAYENSRLTAVLPMACKAGTRKRCIQVDVSRLLGYLNYEICIDLVKDP